MAVDQVVMACGHSVRVTHDSGGRIRTCPTCGEQSIIHARKRTVIDYTVTPLPATLDYNASAAHEEEIDHDA